MSLVMGKKQKQSNHLPKVGDTHPIQQPKPRVTSFVARDCTSCTALRDSDEKAKGRSFSRVYATVGRTRYCKCGYCGNTWKQIETA